jgi:hypothetical protein
VLNSASSLLRMRQSQKKEAMQSGKAVPLRAAFDYLEARVAGKCARRPRARA